MVSTRTALIASAASAALSLAAGSASANYIQLIGLPALKSTGGGGLVSGTIDGNQGYAIMNSSGGGSAQVVRIDDIGGANNVIQLTDLAAFSAAKGSPVTNIAGSIFDNGNSLYISDITNDAIWTISKANGAILQLVDLAVANPTVNPFSQFGSVDIDGDLVYYEGGKDTLDKTTGFLNGFTTVLTDTQLTTFTGDDTPAGLGISSSGVYYFGQSGTVDRGIFFYNPSTNTGGTLLTQDQLVGVGNTPTVSATAFTVLNDTIYLRDGGTNDAFLAVDLSSNAVTTVLDELQLTAGPAASDGAQDFALWNGQLAWTQTSAAGGQIVGFYAIPEPGTAALMGLGGLVMLRRRSA